MNLIAAADKNWGIGKNGDLLCHLPGDMRYFKEKTTGGVVIMGDVTLESLPKKKGLPNRDNLVLSFDPDYQAENAVTVPSIPTLLEELKKYEGKEVFVIGGASVYNALLPYCDTCWITRIDHVFDADRFIPDLDKDEAFELVWESEEQEDNGYRYRFTEYRRKA